MNNQFPGFNNQQQFPKPQFQQNTFNNPQQNNFNAFPQNQKPQVPQQQPPINQPTQFQQNNFAAQQQPNANPNVQQKFAFQQTIPNQANQPQQNFNQKIGVPFTNINQQKPVFTNNNQQQQFNINNQQQQLNNQQEKQFNQQQPIQFNQQFLNNNINIQKQPSDNDTRITNQIFDDKEYLERLAKVKREANEREQRRIKQYQEAEKNINTLIQIN